MSGGWSPWWQCAACGGDKTGANGIRCRCAEATIPEPRERQLLRAVQLLSQEVEAHERRIEALEKDKARLSAALEAIWRALAAYTEAR
jgi:hypothetical protein